MFLVGELDSRDYFKGMGMLKLKESITRDDLGKTMNNRSFQVINLDTLQFFDPDKNAWVDFDKE
jgi:hypothetical protein